MEVVAGGLVVVGTGSGVVAAVVGDFEWVPSRPNSVPLPSSQQHRCSGTILTGECRFLASLIHLLFGLCCMA